MLSGILAAAVIAGTATHGGAVPGASLVRVTTLADDGPGSLRAAVQPATPKVIVFDVGGVIHLNSDIKIATARTTIAGQSAPAPVTLTGASLRVRASDVVIQHIAIRPGPGATPEINGNQDAITIGGGKRPIQDIRVENVSLSWSVDEGADVAGGTDRITFRNNIVAEALRNAGHPKGDHSMGMLVNKDNQAVAVTGNLFAADEFRNPAIARGGSVFVGYNLIEDPGQNAIHFYDVAGATPLQVSLVSNIVQAGSDTKKNVTAVQVPRDMARTAAEIYLAKNQSAVGETTNPGEFTLAEAPPVSLPQDFQIPADVRAWVLRYAGSRPSARDPVDKKIVSESASGTIRIIDDPSQAGGLGDPAPVQLAAPVPANPFEPSSHPGLLRIEAWLCQRHLSVGGPATPECPGRASDYQGLF
jgi:pectate lyase